MLRKLYFSLMLEQAPFIGFPLSWLLQLRIYTSKKGNKAMVKKYSNTVKNNIKYRNFTSFLKTKQK